MLFGVVSVWWPFAIYSKVTQSFTRIGLLLRILCSRRIKSKCEVCGLHARERARVHSPYAPLRRSGMERCAGECAVDARVAGVVQCSENKDLSRCALYPSPPPPVFVLLARDTTQYSTRTFCETVLFTLMATLIITFSRFYRSDGRRQCLPAAARFRHPERRIQATIYSIYYIYI